VGLLFEQLPRQRTKFRIVPTALHDVTHTVLSNFGIADTLRLNA
jgi:hypothetical protein